MKTIFAFLGMFLAIGFASAAQLKEIKSSYHTGYLPGGFDTNDNVVFVAEGFFPNTCYKAGTADLKVDKSKKTITVTQNATKTDGVMCLMMLVPYTKELEVGRLDLGKYTVKDGSTGNTLGEMNVRLATSAGPDDYLYAPVDEVSIENREGAYGVRVAGNFTNSCMVLKEVRLLADAPRVLTVLPIAEMKDETGCKAGVFPFEKTVAVPSVGSGRYLFHVRVLNGLAINKMADLE